MSKRKADNLEDLLSGKTQDCNDAELLALQQVSDELRDNMNSPMPAREAFQDDLKSQILSARQAQRTESMKTTSAKINWQRIFSPPRMAIGVAALLIVAVLATTVQYLPGVGPTQPGAFGTFSRLVINTAHAQDNFDVTATAADSIGVNAETEFVITSKDTVDPADLEQNIQMVPAVPFSFEVIDANTFRVTPEVPLEDRTVYRMEISASFIAETGIQVAREYAWAFQVKDTFKVLNTLPGNRTSGVPVNTGIEVTFSHANVESAEEMFSIEPSVAGRYETHGRTLVFVPERLEAATIYTVTVDGSAHVEGSEETLGEDHVFQFETGAVASGNRSFNFTDDFLQYRPTDVVALPVWNYNSGLEEVETTLYAYDSKEDFIEELADWTSIPSWASNARSQYTFDTSVPSSVAEAALPIQELNNRSYLVLPETPEAGFYVLEARGGDMERRVLIQITDLGAFVQETKTDTIVWAHDTSTGEAANGARVESVEGELVATVGRDGVATFPSRLSVEEGDQEHLDYLVVERGADTVIVELGLPYAVRNGVADEPSMHARHWSYLYTDRSMYHPNDTLQYWGFVKPRSGGSLESQVTVKLVSNGWQNYYHEPIAIDEATIDMDGNTVHGSIDLSRVTPGYYRAEFYAGDSLITSKSLRVQDFEKPAYQLDVVPQALAAFTGEDIAFDVEAKFFEGTPLPELELDAEFQRAYRDTSSGTLTTDALGQALATYTLPTSTCEASHRHCQPSNLSRLTVRPASSEEGDVSATASVAVFSSRISIDGEVEQKDGTATLIAHVDNVTLDRVNEGAAYYSRDNYIGGPSVGAEVFGEVKEIRYEKVETGEWYDFINKVTRKRYKYNRVETELLTFAGQTDSDGLYTFPIDLAEDKTYEVHFVARDRDGNVSVDTDYAYAPRRYREDASGAFYTLEPHKETTVYTVGEEVGMDMKKNDELLPNAENDDFLFMQLQEGLIDHDLQSSGTYTFPFDQDHIPNIYVHAVHFDGGTYRRAYISMFQSGLRYDTSEEELRVEVEADQDRYEPGEEVTLSVEVSDVDGDPVAASVNLNLVDEAFYALVGETADPLGQLYRKISDGTIAVSNTHKFSDVINTEAMAEGGGCFLPGTEIQMADGSVKAIEDVQMGDMILTRKHELSEELVAARVHDTFGYTVPEYMIVNGTLEVTPVHRVFLNGGWQQIGDAKVGDTMIDMDGEVVRIDSIEWKRGAVDVFNFHVEGQHTYFANGLYVHNDKGGERETFVDTALFETVEVGSNGKGEVTFTLPDNITSWRVTTQAISDQVQAGVEVTQIPVSLPLFADTVLPDELLSGDQAILKIRAFGDALSAGDEVVFNISSEGLDVDQDVMGAAYKANYLELPSLLEAQGEQRLSIAAESGDHEDLLAKVFEVVNSRLSEGVQSFDLLHDGFQLEGSEMERTMLVFSDEGQGRFYSQLRGLSWARGERFDQRVGQLVARDLLAEYYDETVRTSDLNLAAYQQEDGGIGLLPYGGSDLELTAQAAIAAPEHIDKNAAAYYFYQVLDGREPLQAEVAMALAGLAALDEPVLIQVQNLNFEEMSHTTKVYKALGALELGDRELAREIYLDILDENGEVNGEFVRIERGGNADASTKATALMAVIGGGLQDEHHVGMWKYVAEVAPTQDILTNMEEAMYLSQAVPAAVPQDVAFTLEIDGRTSEVELERGQVHRVSVTPEQLSGLQVHDVQGDVGVTSFYEQPVARIADLDDRMGIRREYYVDGVQTTNMEDNDLVEVRVYPSFSASAFPGNYQITDILPSGMTIVTRPYHRNLESTSNIRYPMRVEGQEIVFTTRANAEWSMNGRPYFRYYARVVAPGSYVAEPMLMQSMEAPDLRTVSSQTRVQIER